MLDGITIVRQTDGGTEASLAGSARSGTNLSISAHCVIADVKEKGLNCR